MTQNNTTNVIIIIIITNVIITRTNTYHGIDEKSKTKTILLVIYQCVLSAVYYSNTHNRLLGLQRVGNRDISCVFGVTAVPTVQSTAGDDGRTTDGRSKDSIPHRRCTRSLVQIFFITFTITIL